MDPPSENDEDRGDEPRNIPDPSLNQEQESIARLLELSSFSMARSQHNQILEQSVLNSWRRHQHEQMLQQHLPQHQYYQYEQMLQQQLPQNHYFSQTNRRLEPSSLQQPDFAMAISGEPRNAVLQQLLGQRFSNHPSVIHGGVTPTEQPNDNQQPLGNNRELRQQYSIPPQLREQHQHFGQPLPNAPVLDRRNDVLSQWLPIIHRQYHGSLGEQLLGAPTAAGMSNDLSESKTRDGNSTVEQQQPMPLPPRKEQEKIRKQRVSGDQIQRIETLITEKEKKCCFPMPPLPTSSKSVNSKTVVMTESRQPIINNRSMTKYRKSWNILLNRAAASNSIQNVDSFASEMFRRSISRGQRQVSNHLFRKIQRLPSPDNLFPRAASDVESSFEAESVVVGNDLGCDATIAAAASLSRQRTPPLQLSLSSGTDTAQCTNKMKVSKTADDKTKSSTKLEQEEGFVESSTVDGSENKKMKKGLKRKRR